MTPSVSTAETLGGGWVVSVWRNPTGMYAEVNDYHYSRADEPDTLAVAKRFAQAGDFAKAQAFMPPAHVLTPPTGSDGTAGEYAQLALVVKVWGWYPVVMFRPRTLNHLHDANDEWFARLREAIHDTSRDVMEDWAIALQVWHYAQRRPRHRRTALLDSIHRSIAA